MYVKYFLIIESMVGSLVVGKALSNILSPQRFFHPYFMKYKIVMLPQMNKS